MIKGQATIKLIDKETGKIEYEKVEKNMITNAITNLFNPPVPLSLFSRNSYSERLMDYYTPIYSNIFGGIMLFASNLTENANNIIPDKNNFLDFVAGASNQYVGESEFRGTFNETESIKIDDKTFRYVYDFPTNAANGQIASIAMTSGAPFLNKSNNDSDLLSIFSIYGSSYLGKDNINNNYYNADKYYKNYIPPFSYQNLGDFLYLIDTKTFVFIKYYENDAGSNFYYKITKLKMKEDLGLFTNINSNYEDITTISDSDIFEIVSEDLIEINKFSSLQSPIYLTYQGGYIYPVQYKFDSTNESLRLEMNTLNMDTLTVESTKSYFLTSSSFSNRNYYPIYINGKIYITNETDSTLLIFDCETNTFSNLILPAAKLKAMKFFDGVVFCKVDVSNASNASIYYLKEDNTIASLPVCLGNRSNYTFGKFYNDASFFPYPLMLVSDSSATSNSRMNYLNIYVFNPFFLTINNISPIVKHSSQTLKIIYEITEES